MNGEDVAMSEERPSTNVNESQVTTEGPVDQWSPIESLTPLGERLLQLPVSLLIINQQRRSDKHMPLNLPLIKQLDRQIFSTIS